MTRSEIAKFMDNTCKPSFTGENDYYSRDKVLHIIMQLLNNGSKNSRLDDVSGSPRYCQDCGDYVGHGCDNKNCNDFKGNNR